MNGPSRLLVALLLPCLAACGTEREAATQPVPVDGTVVELAPNVPTLALGDIGLSFKESMGIVTADLRGRPYEVEVAFVNKSAERGCLPLPRPVVVGKDYEESLPCLCIGVRKVASADDLAPKETMFLYTVPRGSSAGRPEGVQLEPGSKLARKYLLKSFCLIGHGIAPDPKASFTALYRHGHDRYELRAYLIADWHDLSRVVSNPIELRDLTDRTIDWSRELESLPR